mmetsp:Transcript_74866/g.202271  ORF Transcript_74866/g.202271 Transcript_74866/m.202271 type:complete len:216 (-) Transcript_74866:140-787(-)
MLEFLARARQTTSDRSNRFQRASAKREVMPEHGHPSRGRVSEHTHEPPLRVSPRLSGGTSRRGWHSACSGSRMLFPDKLPQESLAHVAAVLLERLLATAAVLEAHGSQLLQLLLLCRRRARAAAVAVAVVGRSLPQLSSNLTHEAVCLPHQINNALLDCTGDVTIANLSFGAGRAFCEVPPKCWPIHSCSCLVPTRHLDEHIPGDVSAQTFGGKH